MIEKDLDNEHCRYSWCKQKTEHGKKKCPFHLKQDKEASKKRLEFKVTNGICIYSCENKAVSGKKLCEQHLVLERQKRKDIRQSIPEGICRYQSGCTEKSIDGLVLCENHFWRIKAYQHLGSEEHAQILIDMYKKQDYKCFFSKTRLYPGNIAIDHITPKVKGWEEGGYSYKDIVDKKCTVQQLLDNLCLCEKFINTLKFDRTILEFKYYLKECGIEFLNNPSFNL